ncbi:PepSY domain-containing protein [Phenylobacterium sp.]|uniref:PepSY domain-containing protein n=1 Tax=Phenylobacterium sp. TaxID=1871053 RepID=UPI00398380C6
MKRRCHITALLGAALLGTAVPVAAIAQDYGRPVLGADRGDQTRARDGVRSGRQAPLSRVLSMIAQRTPGRHLNTTQGDAGGRPAYFVQWQLPDGRVVVFVVDAESGQILGRQGG